MGIREGGVSTYDIGKIRGRGNVIWPDIPVRKLIDEVLFIVIGN